MKVMRFRVAVFVSSCDFEILSFAINSSRTLIDFAFSKAVLPLTSGESITSIDGMMNREQKDFRENKFCVYRYRQNFFLAASEAR
jgi:hypothetical protein